VRRNEERLARVGQDALGDAAAAEHAVQEAELGVEQRTRAAPCCARVGLTIGDAFRSAVERKPSQPRGVCAHGVARGAKRGCAAHAGSTTVTRRTRIRIDHED
jgi:hypothetical protein